MNLFASWKFLQLLLAASSEKTISVKNAFGDVVRVRVASAAINEMKRPPFILSAPAEKRVWSPEEIAEFYKRNPIFK
jgi:hypothetical protein